jgi:hypothetical protein
MEHRYTQNTSSIITTSITVAQTKPTYRRLASLINTCTVRSSGSGSDKNVNSTRMTGCISIFWATLPSRSDDAVRSPIL